MMHNKRLEKWLLLNSKIPFPKVASHKNLTVYSPVHIYYYKIIIIVMEILH